MIQAADSPAVDAGKRMLRVVFFSAILFSVFQLVSSAFSPLSSTVVRALHVGFLLLLTFLLYPVRGGQGPTSIITKLVGFGALALATYHWIYEADLVARAGELTDADMAVGIVTIALVFEAARRVMGPALPLICLAFLGYALFGEHLPGALGHRGYGLDQVVGQLAFGTEGIYGTPTYVSSSYIFLFILFGAFLEQAGMITLFTDFALGTVGHTKGGPAKVSVVSSGLMGTINGSGVANVVTTGQFTIPLMKKFGYKPAFAGAVEATSSMGGQIMPPVMGAVAFIMAETINVPYVEIAKAAAIPALLYFFTVFWMVHLEAGRAGLKGLPKEECPDPWVAVRQRWYLLLPLIGLVYLLFAGFTPMFAGMVGLALTVVLIFGASLARRLNGTSLRLIFWIALGLACSAFAKVGIISVVVVVAALAVLLAVRREGRDTLKVAVTALVEGALHAMPVGVACALVGVIIGSLTLTGGATTFAGYIIQIGASSLFLSLVLTMLTCLVLGMGIPTIPNYIITSSIAAPALLELGVPLIVSHMFVFYFGIMADLTPPVALAAFAAAPIAKETGLKIGMKAVQIAIAGFIVPYMAVYAPELMLQGDKGLDATVYVVFKALLAVTLWGIAVVGYFRSPMNVIERVLAFVAASCLVVAMPITDEIGFGLAAVVLGWHIWRSRSAQALTV
ncbi:TRAP transporter permease [Parazoarcus communis]|uniref:TRAP transporter permease n=1 Tax=Parazoarcus communis SWub3 = DSM 12120 TaxID=1121029 RepID=A0A323UTK1_9RHOO|nr:TRAP transporter permease [Parazoarcus communis]NMG72494.1 TRAP transporter fused permease subunit [Parazoarcus communis SWub3 = DSM 12120]PZA15621.1 TRAP transporter permease [Azoarcus communis] [Parazoarcus communis SWub3 = DSM 12120]